MKTVDKFLPPHCYTAENTVKKRICLHHTVSSPLSIAGDVATWSATRNIATHYIIGGDGTIYRTIPDNYWAHHLGLKTANNLQLNKETIGIELDAWGILKQTGNGFMNAYGKPFDRTLPVEELDKAFRGSRFYQEYSQAQIDSLQVLLQLLSVDYKIPLQGLNKSLNFELLSDFSKPGIYSHSNFRADKSDAYPARRLVSMLKML